MSDKSSDQNKSNDTSIDVGVVQSPGENDGGRDGASTDSDDQQVQHYTIAADSQDIGYVDRRIDRDGGGELGDESKVPVSTKTTPVENTRATLALRLVMGLLTVSGITLIGAAYKSSDVQEFSTIFSVVFTGLSTLTGTAVAYYFTSKNQ